MRGADQLLGLLAEVLAGIDEGRSAPARLCAAIPRLLPVTGASITVVAQQGVREALCVSGPAAAEVEELQLTCGIGPCVDAFVWGRPVLVADLADPRDVRWPGFTADAVAAGAAAVFAFPLQIGAIRLGVLDLCRDRPGGLNGRGLTDALLVADVVTLTLLAIAEGSPEDALGEACQDGSLLHRSEIHQATGMAMVQLGVDVAEAFVRLRALAYAEGQPLSEIARSVVARERQLSSVSPEEEA